MTATDGPFSETAAPLVVCAMPTTLSVRTRFVLLVRTASRARSRVLTWRDAMSSDLTVFLPGSAIAVPVSAAIRATSATIIDGDGFLMADASLELTPTLSRNTLCPSRVRWCPAKLSRAMKTGIHPEYVLSHVHCSCGNDFYTRSTKADLHVEICSECHPFYTGKQKLVDTGGRVERFRRRAARSQK